MRCDVNYVVIDIETTGLHPQTDDIIEIGAVRLRDDQITDTFHSFLAPTKPLPDAIVELTGITDDMLTGAPSWRDVVPKLLQFIGDDVIVAHNLAFDGPFLQAHCEREGYTLLREDGLCTLRLSRMLLPTRTTHRLEALVSEFDIPLTNAHRALSDATATALLFAELGKRVRHLPLILVQQLTHLAGMYSAVTSDWFRCHAEHVLETRGEALADDQDVRDGLLYTTTPTNHDGPEERTLSVALEEIEQRATALLQTNGPLSLSLPNYEARDGQIRMVEQVSQALTTSKHAIIEAGTGTGKSMAYLIPAALYALATGERVVVSTHTIALQDQIEQRDFPTLQHLFDNNLRLAIQKGRKNYVCLRKVKSEASVMSFVNPMEEIESIMSLLTWLSMTEDGTRETLSSHAVTSTVWTRVQSETDSCINKRCPFFRPCYYFRAKNTAQTADVVVTNHSLLLSDIKSGNRVLPRYDALVIDEAHHLEEQATKHLGNEVHQNQLAALAYRIRRDRGKNGILTELLNRLAQNATLSTGLEEELQQAEEWVEVIHRATETAFAQLGSAIPRGKSEVRLTDIVYESEAFRQYTATIDSVKPPVIRLRTLVKSLQEASKHAANDEEAGRIVDAAGFLDGWLEQVEFLGTIVTPSAEYVTWVEQRGSARPRFSVHRAPLDVSNVLSRELFDQVASVVLTSATLSVKGNFDYSVNQLGLKRAQERGQLITGHVASPFNYQTQARLCIPTDVPELAKMTAQEAAMWLGDSLFQLAVASNGRVLALFTSHQMLKETANILREPLRQKNVTLLAQDVDGGRTAMLDAFRRNPQSVLLGAQSFWEGIDLPGDQLTTLVIVRLPFAPPTHPVTEARHERLEARGVSPFWAASLPDAVVRFRQGFGRLIRTKQDKGVVVVYDKRIVTQRYGQTFVQSLPGVKPFAAPEGTVLQHIQDFLSETAK